MSHHYLTFYYILLLVISIYLKSCTTEHMPDSNIELPANISPDSKRLYHDIVSGHGLYNGFNKLTEMGGSNFKTIVFSNEKHKLWLVEFYNSWCGHCHRFAPIWKGLAADLHEWRDVVGVGAVDCANDANNQLCRDLEVMYYPMIKLFPPGSSDKVLGDDFQKDTIDVMRKNVIIKLKSHQTVGLEIGRVNLKPYSDSTLAGLWNDVPSQVQYIVLVFEPEESVVGAELALDLSRTSEVQVRLVEPSNEPLAQLVGIEQGSNGAVLVLRDSTFTNIEVVEHTRTGLNKAVRQALVDRGVNVPLELPENAVIITPEVNIGDVMNIMQMEEEIKKKLQTTALSTIVFQMDLEGAIRYSLKNEVPLHRNITGDRLHSLNKYMHVLIKYFPFGQQGMNFLKKLKHQALDHKTEVSGQEFRQTFLQLETELKPFLPKQGWIGCRGSQPEFRGYPCSLWTLFHTLTVNEEIKDRNITGDGPDVVHAMAGYIKNFFTCSECAGHFTEMAKTIAGNVTTQNDSILWLWAAHNNVNKRLAGDSTEDPKHKKIQFPNEEACPACRTSDGSWNNTEVLKFLTHMYAYRNIVYLQEEDLEPHSTTTATPSVPVKYDKSLRHEIYEDEQGYKNRRFSEGSRHSLWDFNVFDISLCVVLYVISVTILILVCIKFVFKRSYRKKTYNNDTLSKV